MQPVKLPFFASKAQITPEFTAFMEYYKGKGLKHLYVSNQNEIPCLEDETERCDLLRNFANKMKGTLYLAVMPKNSPFYLQKDEFATMTSAKDYKKALHDQFFKIQHKKSGCYFSDGIKEEIKDLDKHCARMIEQIHQKLFTEKKNGVVQPKENLSLEERRIFTEEFYDCLDKFLIVNLKVDSENSTCKDDIDRGAGHKTRKYGNALLLNDLEKNLVHQIRFLVLMMVRALFVRKRAPKIDRVEMVEKVIQYNTKRKEAFKKLHQSIFGDLKFIPLAPSALG